MSSRDYSIDILVDGTEQDIEAMWKALPGLVDFEIEFDGGPSGTHAEGGLDFMPERYDFDALISNFPDISLCITVTDDACDVAYWCSWFTSTGLNDPVNDHEHYEMNDIEEAEKWLQEQREIWSVSFVAPARRTKEKCLEMMTWDHFVSLDGFDIVPEEYWNDPEFCLAAVERCEGASDFVNIRLDKMDDAYKTAEICLLAIKQNSNAFEYVPEACWQDRNFCLKALSTPLDDDQVDFICGFITDWTSEEALLHASYEGRIIKHIKNLTVEICLAAVQENGHALEYVPEDLKTPELCLAAVQKHGRTLEYVPEDLKTPEIYLAAMTYNADAFLKIPMEMRTREICLIALKTYGSILDHIPDALKTEDFYLAAVKVNENGKALKYTPKNFRTPEVCAAAVEKSSDALEYVPENLKQQIKDQLGIEDEDEDED
jgi:hypothetical protein